MAYGGAGAGGVLFLGPLLMILFRQKYPRRWFDWNLELQRLLDYPHAAPEVGFQLSLCLPDRALLDRAGQAPSSAGDKRVDPAADCQHARHAGAYRIVIIDVHDQASPPTRGGAAPACPRDGPAGRMQLPGAGPADASRCPGDQHPPRTVAHGCSDLPAGPDSPADKPVTESYARHLRTRPHALVPARRPGPDRQVDSCCKPPTQGWRTSTRSRRPAAMASSRDFHGFDSRPSHGTGRLR